MRRRIAHLFAAALALLMILWGGARPAFAGPATDAVRAHQTALFGLFARSGSDAEILARVDAMLDGPTLAEQTLSEVWAERTSVERAEYSAVFRDFVSAAVARHFRRIVPYDL